MAVVVPSAAPARRAASAEHAALKLFQQRRDAAARWRLDHRSDEDRDRMWRAFTTGARRGIGHLHPAIARALTRALAAAERDVPFDEPTP